MPLILQFFFNNGYPSLLCKVAKSHSTCPSGKNGGKLGSFSPGSMVREFDAVCFDPETEVGRVYGPVKTQFGYHLIKVTSKPDQNGKVKKE
jgi:peptidyl-prolyl cis-trans isomerase C